MKKAILLMLLGLQAWELSGQPGLTGQPIKIMLLGNSITQGDKDHYSYRYNLWFKLNNSSLGVNFDFVGSMTTNFNGSPSFPDRSFDRDHEGHWGWTADELLDGLPDWLMNYTPDIVLIHAGSNDALQSQNTSGTVAELEKIIECIRAANANATILLAKIIPVNSRANTNVNALNAEI